MSAFGGEADVNSARYHVSKGPVSAQNRSFAPSQKKPRRSGVLCNIDVKVLTL